MARGRKPAQGHVAAPRADVREFLRQLPVTRNPVTGEDYTQADWFTSGTAYPSYTRAAELLRPTSILEVGAFLGFGLTAFLYGYPDVKTIVAVDNESYIEGSQKLCQQNLAFHRGRKRFVDNLEEARGRHDLIHVDADTSFDGTLDHIAFAWGLGPRIMLVDDYTFLPEVRRAVDAFAARHKIPFKVWQSYRGWAVFASPGAFEQLPDNL